MTDPSRSRMTRNGHVRFCRQTGGGDAARLVNDYDQVLGGVPFVRNAWAYDRFHELDLPLGELLLFALCAQPYESGEDSRVALLDAVAARAPGAVLGIL